MPPTFQAIFEVISKPHLKLGGCVVTQIETYCLSASGGFRFQFTERLDAYPDII